MTHNLRRAGGAVLSRFGYVSRDEVSSIFDATFMRRFVESVERGRSIGSFAGGRSMRQYADFMPSAMGPNAAHENYGDLLCRRVRSLIDSNPFIDGALQTFQNEVCGSGIVVQPDTGDDELNKRIEDAWHRFAEAVDVDRSMSVYESQRLALSEFWGGGECFVHFAITDDHRGRPGGPSVSIIERERLPLHDGWFLRSGIQDAGDGLQRRQSLEIDRIGRVHAYHILDSDPNDALWSAPSSRRIPAEQIEHMYRRRRASQLRGLPIPMTAVLSTEDHDAFVEACLYLARMVAAMGIVLKTGRRNVAVAPAGAEMTELDGTPVSSPRPGFIWKIGPEDEVKSIASSTPAPGLADASRVILRAMAAGLGVSYSRLARDYSQSNYSSSRQEELGDRRGYGTMQWLLWNKHDYPLYTRWLRWELAVGSLRNVRTTRLGARLFAANPLMPGWTSIDPSKDSKADETDLRMGVVSPQTLASRRGLDYRVELRKRLEAEAEENKIRKELGLGPKVALPANGSVDPHEDDAGDTSEDLADGNDGTDPVKDEQS